MSVALRKECEVLPERQQRHSLVRAAISGGLACGLYQRHLLSGDVAASEGETRGYVALYQLPDGVCELTIASVGLYGRDQDIVDAICDIALPRSEGGREAHEAAAERLALNTAQQRMAPFGLPAAIAAFVQSADGSREAVVFMYPVILGSPHYLFEVFKAEAGSTQLK